MPLTKLTFCCGPYSVCIFPCALLLISPLSFATESTDSAETHASEDSEAFASASFSTVVVSKKISTAPDTEVISEREIELSGARNLPEVLMHNPNVEVNESPKSGATLEIRGFDERATLILFEGIPIREVYDGHFDVASLPVFAFGTVRLETGVTSLLHGPNSAGGIVHMNTQQDCTRMADVSLYGRAALRDAALMGQSAKICRAFSRLTLSISFGREYSNGFPLPKSWRENTKTEQFHEDGNIRDASDYERSAIALSAGYRRRKNQKLVLFANVVNSPRSVPTFEAYGYRRNWRFDIYQTLLLGLSGIWGPSHRSTSPNGFRELRVQLYTHMHQDEIRDYEDSEHLQLTTNTLAWFVASAYANETYGVASQADFRLFKGNMLTVSLRYQLDKHGQREIPVPKVNETNTWTQWETFASHVFSGAVEDMQHKGPLQLTVGVGASGMSLLAQELRGVSYDVSSRVIPAFEGRVVGKYEPTSKFTLISSLGHKVRYPTLKELFSNSIGGNPTLKAERAWMSEAGFDTANVPFKGLNVSVRCFFSSITDLIDKYRDAYANVGHALIAGGTAELNYTPLRLLQLYSNYRYLHTRDLEYNRPLDNRTPHRLKGGIRIQSEIGFIASMEVVYSSGQHSWFVDPATGSWSEDTLSPFTLLNGQLRYEHRFKNSFEAVAYLNGKNLLDTEYSLGSHEPRPGRELIIGIGGRI